MKNTLVKTTLMARQIGLRQPRPGEVGPQPIWLCQGSSDDDAGDGDVDGGADGDDDGDADAGGGNTDGTDAKKTKAPTQEEFDRIQKHLSNADRKKVAAERKVVELETRLKALETKDLPEAERAKAEHEEVVKDRDGYKSKFEKLARTNAFLLASESEKLAWANSSAAIRVGDLDDLEIEADGTVPGMTEAIKKLAADHPYLLAPKDSTDTEEKNTPPAKSGSVVGSKKKGAKVETKYTDEELARIFPSLR
jgi:hypothetical protein